MSGSLGVPIGDWVVSKHRGDCTRGLEKIFNPQGRSDRDFQCGNISYLVLVVSKYGGHHTLEDLKGTFRGEMSWDGNLPTGDLVVSKYGGHHTLGDLTGTFRGQMSGDEGIGNDVDAM